MLRVLLVEDSPLLAERLRESLVDLADVEVVDTVDNESEAGARVLAASVNVLVLDQQLKSGTGFGVLRALGERRPIVIMLTNYALPEYRLRARELGVDYFLDKSTDSERLHEVIASLREHRAH